MSKQNVAFQRIEQIFFALCKTVDSPVSLGLWLRCKHKVYDDIATFSVDPADYLQADAFRQDYLVANYIKKNVALPCGFDTKAEAFASFVESETTCQKTNLELPARKRRSRITTTSLSSILFTAQKKIAKVLGPLDESDWLDRCKWGPGATFSLKRDESHLHNKLTLSQIDVTLAALPYLRKAMAYDLHWLRARLPEIAGPCCLLDDSYTVVRGGRFGVVPKNAKTDRCICVEPTGNTFLQGGVGKFMRMRLMSQAGIDLSNQGVNQDLARRALKELLATIDLSAASDSICREIIWELLPYEWACLLEDLRSPSTYLGKPFGEKWIDLHKHSSMGNGYTFELETLIFWALSASVMEQSAVKGPLSVYGDDIILPASVFDTLKEVFDACGFTINKSKSFTSGLFYESCGKHYFDGVDVTPVYQKDTIANLQEYYGACNRLARFGARDDLHVLDSRVKPAWSHCRRLFKPKHFIPLHFPSDEGLGLIGREWKSRVVRYQHGSPCFKVQVSRTRKLDLTDSASLLAYSFRFKAEEQANRATGNILGLDSPKIKSTRLVDWLCTVDEPTPFEGKISLGASKHGRTKVRPFPGYREDVVWDTEFS